jgi:hypothetical protein
MSKKNSNKIDAYGFHNDDGVDYLSNEDIDKKIEERQCKIYKFLKKDWLRPEIVEHSDCYTVILVINK